MKSAKIALIFTIILVVTIATVKIVKIVHEWDFNDRILQSYSMFTNKQLNKQLVRSNDKIILVADEIFVACDITNIRHYEVSFSKDESDSMTNLGSDSFIHIMVSYVLMGTFTNQWKMSEKIIIHHDESQWSRD